jgi:hypothetical protein
MYRGYAVRYRARTCAQLRPLVEELQLNIFDYRHGRLNTFFYRVSGSTNYAARSTPGLAYRLHGDS